jgi:hypothetical protein
VLALAALLSAQDALAQSTFLPYASTQYEHNNNIFDLPNSQAALTTGGSAQLGDSSLKTIGGAEEDYYWERQRFYGTVEGRYIEYDHNTDLNHTEYLLKLGLDWKLFSAFDGTLLGSLERYMAPFANRDTFTGLSVDTDRSTSAKVNWRLSPEWLVLTSVLYHDLDAPVEGYPNYGLSETTTHLAFQYLGVANLTFGAAVDYLDGHYHNVGGLAQNAGGANQGAPIQGTYDQTGLDLTASYAVTRLSTFKGAVGYTERDQGQGQGSVSAVTGDLGYTRTLTGKTSLSLDLTRAVNSYVAAGGSELDTIITLRANHQLTYKIGISAGVQEMRSKFLGQTIPIPCPTGLPGCSTSVLGRHDQVPEADIKITYDVRRWLMIQPYATYQRRTSNYPLDEFTSTIIGIKVQAKMQPPPTR